MTRAALLCVLLVVVGGALWTPHDPTAAIGPAWSPPGGDALLGTDALGRDVLSRVLAGGADLLLIALLAAACASAVGLAWGLVAGWTGRGGALLADVLMAVPFLVLALLFAVTLPGWAAVVAGTVCGGAPLTARLVGDLTRRTRATGYVEAALGRGERTASVLCREVLPSIARYAVADAALRFVVALQLASALAVLGFGARPPAPDWGLMLRENLPGAALNPAGVLGPAAALTALSLAVALAGHGAAPRPRTPRPGTPRPAASEDPTGVTTARGLSVDGLSVVDGRGRVLLDDFSALVAPGEVVGLAGPSGAGKTTAVRGLLDTLDGDAVKVAGTTRWQGSPVRPGRAAHRWRREHVGVLDQDPAGTLDPRHTVGRALGPAGLAVLAELGLDPAGFRDRLPRTLSGGQARRVALARALTGAPAVLVLDEPTAGLHPEAVDLVARVVLARRGDPSRVTLLVSHDEVFLARVADRVLAVGVVAATHVEALEPRPSGPTALAVDRLTVRRGGRTVLRDLTLDVAAGEVVAVVGESGSGKSTLLRALAGLVPADTGEVRRGRVVLPRAVADRDRAALRAVQLLAQDPADALNPAHTAGTAITRPLRVLGDATREAARSRVPDLLAGVGLAADTAHRRPGRLSGGQRQRVALARALAAEPAVLLADEPTAALDRATAATVLDLLDDLRDRGLAVLVATHDPAVAARADRVLRLSAGRLTTDHPAHHANGASPRVP
ncbi:ATP-binding cassette domain-containing protein [Saccharothrix longispora]|uniref:Peptide/nickel transport system ATP-binding protein n=1 Tax=Saccharothrix longispora TaxID=33920 RepID=A0ABU1PS10_9PSEU|nr:ATP-binding cassette domain-containing protein [Saccharothrix longispora]MDR6593423.1 peptide/nickel transport system ATP-binding protein [Saccharothrix longispora]